MSEEYVRDVDAAIASVTKNYAGYADKRERFGAAVMDAAERTARARAQTASSHEDCLRVLHEYLSVFQDGHVSALYFDAEGELQNAKYLDTPRPVKATSPDPSARLVGEGTIVLTIPDFSWEHKAAIDALLAEHETELRSRAQLIIDVRGNGGGSDDSYAGLIPYLYTKPIVTVGVDILATPESADAWEAILTRVPTSETELLATMRERIARMRDAPEGTFIEQNPDSVETLPEVLPNPVRVAVLIDGGCASTTEQFLLEARQSDKVTIFGKPTAGVLDYANVRLFPLPSGKRMLGLATTRSRRLPENPVDNIGIAPDMPLETPNDAVASILDYLLALRVPPGAPAR